MGHPVHPEMRYFGCGWAGAVAGAGVDGGAGAAGCAGFADGAGAEG
jgi:hypothetical protein